MPPLTLKSQRFGLIEFPEEELYHFEGLPGFERARRFVLIRHDRESPFEWLICADDCELGFVVADPRQFFPEYQQPQNPALESAVGASSDALLDLLSIVHIRSNEMTLNLLAPVVLHAESRRGAQVILDGDSTQMRVPLPKLSNSPGRTDPHPEPPGRPYMESKPQR